MSLVGILAYAYTEQIEAFSLALVSLAVHAGIYYWLNAKTLAGMTACELDTETHPSEPIASVAILATSVVIGYFILDIDYVLMAVPMLFGMSYTTILSALVYYDIISIVDTDED